MKRTYGAKIGPTGRKRDDFHVYAIGHKPYGKPRPELVKAYKGTTGLKAYGCVGVKEAKRSVHHANPHKWVKFSVYNESRMHRRYRNS